MTDPSPYEIQRLAGDLYKLGVVSHDQRERLDRLSLQNSDFARAFHDAAMVQGNERQERLLQLVGPPDGSPPPHPTSVQPVSTQAQRGSGVPSYTDAYRVASTLGFVGGLAKVLGILVMALAGIAFLKLLEQGDFALLAGLPLLIGGGLVGLLLLFIGVLISAQGQLLRASLDTATHTAKLVRLVETGSLA